MSFARWARGPFQKRVAALLDEGVADVPQMVERLASDPGTVRRAIRRMESVKGKDHFPIKKHLVIPDTQVTPSTPIEHLGWIGKYIQQERPDVVVCLGDFCDMESLSSFDRGRRNYEGRRYKNDIESAHNAMAKLMAPIKYGPELHLTLGNHEFRIERATQESSELHGILSMSDLGYEAFGWKVYDFLDPVEIDGVFYAHYFANPMSGRPYGGQSIDTRLKNIGFSFTQGHQQTLMVGQRFLNNGRRIRGIVAGSCYLHDEDYRGPQSNGEWRGVLVKHEVRHGEYDLMEVSLDYLCRKFEGVQLWRYMQSEHPEIFRRSAWLRHSARECNG